MVSIGDGRMNFDSSVCLSNFEKELLEKNEIDSNVALLVRKKISGEFFQLIYHPEDEEIKGVGITVTSDDDMEELIESLRASVSSQGYLVFMTKKDYEFNDDTDSYERISFVVGLIKGNDQFDIVRAMRTNAFEYSLKTEDIVNKLKEWHERWGLKILGAEYDWVDAIFINQPENMLEFANEVYEFSPDVVMQITGSEEELAHIMEESNSVYLWWD